MSTALSESTDELFKDFRTQASQKEKDKQPLTTLTALMEAFEALDSGDDAVRALKQRYGTPVVKIIRSFRSKFKAVATNDLTIDLQFIVKKLGSNSIYEKIFKGDCTVDSINKDDVDKLINEVLLLTEEDNNFDEALGQIGLNEAQFDSMFRGQSTISSAPLNESRADMTTAGNEAPTAKSDSDLSVFNLLETKKKRLVDLSLEEIEQLLDQIIEHSGNGGDDQKLSSVLQKVSVPRSIFYELQEPNSREKWFNKTHRGQSVAPTSHDTSVASGDEAGDRVSIFDDSIAKVSLLVVWRCLESRFSDAELAEKQAELADLFNVSVADIASLNPSSIGNETLFNFGGSETKITYPSVLKQALLTLTNPESDYMAHGGKGKLFGLFGLVVAYASQW